MWNIAYAYVTAWQEIKIINCMLFLVSMNFCYSRITLYSSSLKFLKQTRAGLLTFMWICLCVCSPPRQEITSGGIWTSCDWLSCFTFWVYGL